MERGFGGGTELKEGALILTRTVTYPRTFWLFTLTGEGFVVMQAVPAAMEVTIAVWAKAVFLLDIEWERGTTIMALPKFHLTPSRKV